MLNKPSRYAAIGAVLTAFFGAGPSWAQGPAAAAIGEYNPVINPEDFVPEINNKYFTLKPGTKFIYEDKRGIERIEISVTGDTKKVMGVTTTVVRAREWKNGVLWEDTYDWYAQDKAGNVWYFGEAVDNYRFGTVAHHAGSWQAGVDEAKPGIVMRADPKVGDSYRQEYYRWRAEDMGTVVATDKTVAVPHGTFENCLQIEDWSLIEQGREYKYYCPAIGFLVREEKIGGAVEADLVGMVNAPK
jgi:hypothetical protein